MVLGGFKGRAARRTTVIALLAALTGAGALAPPPAKAAVPADSTELAISGPALRAALFLAIDLPRLTNPASACEALVLEAALLQRYAVPVDRTPQQVADELQALRDSYRALRGADACARRFLNEGVLDLLAHAEASATLGPAAKAAFARVGKEVTALSASSGNGVGDRGLTALGDLSDALGEGVLAPARLIQRAIDTAATNPAYAAARDALLLNESSRSITAGLAQLLDHPSVQEGPFDDLIADGTLRTTFGGLMALVTAAQGQLDVMRDAARATLVGVDTNPGANSPTTVAVATAAREATILAQRRTLVVAAHLLERSAAGPAAEAVRAAAQRVKTIVQLGVKVTQAVVRLAARAVNRAGQVLAPFGRAARQMLNQLGIFALGNVAQEDRDARMLAEFQKVRDDIAGLRTEMNARFDRVDARLDEIYDEMVTRFDEVNQKLDTLATGLRNVRDEVARLAARVERLERNVYQLFKDSQDRELWTQVNTAIGYRERSVGGVPMSNSEFLGFEGFFFSWATSSAYDSIATGPVSRAYDEDAVEGELAAVPLEGNLGYLSGFLAARFGLPPLSSNRLPNLRDFSVAAQAYAALLAENPEYVTAGVRTRLDAILERGRDAQRAIARLSAKDSDGGTGSRTFDAAVAAYRAAASDPVGPSGKHSLASALKAVEDAFVASLRSVRDNPLGLDPWGGASQPGPVPFDSDTPNVGNSNCDPFDIPASFNREVAMDPVLRNSLRLNGGEARVVCGVTRSNERTEPVAGGETRYLADFRVEFRVERRATGGTTPWSLHKRRYRDFRDHAYCQSFSRFACEQTAEDVAGERWFVTDEANPTTWEALFDQSGVNEVAPSFADLVAGVEEALKARQRAAYQHIAGQLDDEPLRGALARLTGAKGVLDAFAEFGLWRAMDEDADLRNLLTGRERLPAGGLEGVVGQRYVAAAAAPTLPAANVRGTLGVEVFQKANALVPVLRRIVDDGAGTSTRGLRAGGTTPGAQTNPLLETTVQRLVVTRGLPGPPPATDPPAGGGGTTDPPAGGTPPPADGTGGTTPTPTGGGGTGSGSGSPAGAGPGGGPVQRPSLLSGLKVAATRIGALRRGLPVTLRAQRPGRLAARLTVDAKTAKALGLGTKTVLGSAATTVRKAGPAKVVVKVGTGVLAKLRRSRATVPATLRATLTAADGTVSREATAKVVLRR